MNNPLGTTFCLMLAVTAMSVQSSARATWLQAHRYQTWLAQTCRSVGTARRHSRPTACGLAGQTVQRRLQAGQTAAQPTPAAPGFGHAASAAVLSKYCITCHNEKRKTAGLAIDTLDLQRVGADAEVWEKVARKFRRTRCRRPVRRAPTARPMPP